MKLFNYLTYGGLNNLRSTTSSQGLAANGEKTQ